MKNSDPKNPPMNKLQARRFYGILFGSLFAFTLLIWLIWPSNENYHAQGPMNKGHENLSCIECHHETKGSFRQQLQAKIRYVFGLRHSTIEIGHMPVNNEVCLQCHSRPNEQHPIYRFNEPRFAEIRKQIAPQNCITCHRDHKGNRVSNVNLEFCLHCHKDTKLKKDTLDISHETLIRENRWNTCMGCHDYHGNHKRKVPEQMQQVIPTENIQKYFEGKADSPYSTEKLYPSKTTTLQGENK